MKRKTAIILLIVLVALPAIIAAKVVRRQLGIFSSNVPSSTVVSDGSGLTEFVYDYSFSLDSSGVDDRCEADKMLLQIAPDGVSKFTSLTNITADSICMNATPEQRVQAIEEGRMRRGDPMNVFKNYPVRGRMTNTEIICTDWFRYEEDMPAIDWQLTDSIATILGYECKSARCLFRGREWTVFYSEDIPIMDGPWKLQGLPGLIMKASADGDAYTFECIGIKNNAQRAISIYDVPYNDTDRRKFYDTKHRYDINPFAYFEASGGSIAVTDENGNPDPTAFDPLPLTYDYIEADWRSL